jgi:7,8-dihydroneopterin aldolase/epimerase/oxygenase
MTTITLQGVTFFAYHGFYPEEQKLGNCFIVDIAVDVEPGEQIDDINSTVNYEQLYAIVHDQMTQTRKLIETVADGILKDIKINYPGVERISVTVKKMNPPLNHKVDYAGVTVNYSKQ